VYFVLASGTSQPLYRDPGIAKKGISTNPVTAFSMSMIVAMTFCIVDIYIHNLIF
jgi:hypothetical protein